MRVPRTARHAFSIAAIAAVVWWFAAGASCQPYYYYETRFVGRTPGVNDFAAMSAEEDVGAATLAGIFADFSTGGLIEAINTAAVLDANYTLTATNSFYPTGHLLVAKTQGSGNYIDVHAPVNYLCLPQIGSAVTTTVNLD